MLKFIIFKTGIMIKIISILLLILLYFNLYCNQKVFDYANEILDKNKTVNNTFQIEKTDFFENQSVIVWGTSTDDDDELDINEMLAYNIVDFRIKRWINQKDNVVDIIEDSELTPEIIENYNLILIGASGSNLWTKLLAPFLPVQISEEEIRILDRTFSGDEVGISYRFPNPLNPYRQLWILSAPNYEAIRFLPRKEDYCIYQITDYNPNADRFLELAQGYFDENWELKIVEMVDNVEIYSGEDDPIAQGDITFYDIPGWAYNGVMYEIFVRSFYDSDNDGIGDIQGIIEKLDYLNDGDPETGDDLGIKSIWLMPVFESPSYHCYDVSDYYKIESDYGTNEDFQELLREAHKRGIKIITDLVLNHCSSQHEYFKDAFANSQSRFDNWFYFTNSSNTRAHNWQFRHRDKDRNMLEPYMPAWNVNNPEVREYLYEMAKYWIDPDRDGNFTDGVDGFRCDYVKGPPHEFWKMFRQEVKSVNPDVLLLAENWEGLGSIAQSFDNEFDMAFDFPFQGSLVASITSASAMDFRTILLEQERILPDNALMNRFFNNHDMNRIFTRMDEDQAKLGLALLLTVPQMPMLYYGDEIGMKGQKDPYDEGIRRPMEWCRNNDCKGMTNWYPVWDNEPDGISVEEETDDPGSILSFVRNLIRLRSDYPVIETGEIQFVPLYTTNEMKEYKRGVAYLVGNDQEGVLVIANLHREEQELKIDFADLPVFDQVTQLVGERELFNSSDLEYISTFTPRSIKIYRLGL